MNILKEIEELAKKDIYITYELECIGSDEWEFCYIIQYLPKEAQSLKRRAGSFIRIHSFTGGGATYSGAWPTITEALEGGVKHAQKYIVPLV